MSFPYLNAREESSQIPSSLIEELRNRFLQEVAKNPDQYYQKDVDCIKSNDWPLQRFLHLCKDKTFEKLVKAMKWRKEFGVIMINETDIPKEIFQSGCIFVYGEDLNNNPVMIIRVKTLKKSKSWVSTFEKYLVFLFEKIDSSNRGLTILIDCKGAGVTNVDINLQKFIFTVAEDYFPGLVASGLVHKLPAVLEAVYKVARNWLPDDHKKYVYLTKEKTINNFIANEQLPDFLLGTNTKSYRTVPSDAPSAQQLAKKLNLKEGKAEKLVKQLEPFFST